VQHREPLRSEFTDQAVGTRKVASRPIEARHKPKLHGIGGDVEHNWDARGGSLSRESRKQPGRDDHGDSKLDQISRQRWQSVSLVSRPAIFDHKVPAFNIADFVQTPSEASQPRGVRLRRPVVQISDHRHRGLLRARRERPRNCPTTEQRDELAPPHAEHGAPSHGCRRRSYQLGTAGRRRFDASGACRARVSGSLGWT